MHPENLSITDYIYFLPEQRISKYPLPERDASKLLIYRRGKMQEDIYQNLDSHLPSNSLLIFNNTKVIEARLFFQKSTGGVIEIFCLEPDEQFDVIKQKNKVHWQCLVGGASKWKHGQILEKKIKASGEDFFLHARYIDKKNDCFIIEFSWTNDHLNFTEVLHYAGTIPLPPYLKRESEKSDEERYQTIYAKHVGSVAAPTAGLHFTTKVLERIKAKNIQTDFVTLHVGAGTFRPVKSKKMKEHEMHAELINVSKSAIENILSNLSEHIISVGTTSLRTLETIYWLGVKLNEGNENDLMIHQWEPYQLRSDISPKRALETLLDFMNKKNWGRIITKTQILIAPSYKFKIANALITNFHQPQSTLLLLVAAFIGNDWKKVYAYALENDFRFLSYGDGCLLWSNQLVQKLAK